MDLRESGDHDLLEVGQARLAEMMMGTHNGRRRAAEVRFDLRDESR
jgi:hypothetical protein